jgi:hypothetical protein
MNLKFPTSPSAVMPPQHRTASLPLGEMGLAAGFCRKLAGRLLSLSEPQSLLVKAVVSTASAATIAAVGAVAAIGGYGPYHPWTALALIGTASAGLGVLVTRFSAAMREYERRNEETKLRLADKFADAVARLNLQAALTHAFHAAGAFEGTPAASGEVAGSRGDRKERLPATDAPNVVFPQFPNFRRH